MKMRTNWTQLLIIGIINLLFVISCTKMIDGVSYASFIYKNSSTKNLYFKVYRKNKLQTFTLYPSDSLNVKVDLFYGPELNDIVLYESDSIKIINNTSFEQIWYPTIQSIRNPMVLSNYENKYVSKNEQIFKFEFFESDF
jgi:hypothetical protein